MLDVPMLQISLTCKLAIYSLVFGMDPSSFLSLSLFESNACNTCTNDYVVRINQINERMSFGIMSMNCHNLVVASIGDSFETSCAYFISFRHFYHTN
jgi:hypothetical protein